MARQHVFGAITSIAGVPAVAFGHQYQTTSVVRLCRSKAKAAPSEQLVRVTDFAV
jgi:hypothetical protein